eukprot:351773-Chlamydomonas_euryale.AAC.24
MTSCLGKPRGGPSVVRQDTAPASGAPLPIPAPRNDEDPAQLSTKRARQSSTYGLSLCMLHALPIWAPTQSPLCCWGRTQL